MSTSPSIIDTRRDQMFPVLEPFEIERVRRFGKMRSYDDAAALVKVGQVGPGLTIILTGQVEVARRDELGHSTPIVTHGPGSFMGELAQLAGRPALIDAHAREPVQALIISPDQLRPTIGAERSASLTTSVRDPPPSISKSISIIPRARCTMSSRPFPEALIPMNGSSTAIITMAG